MHIGMVTAVEVGDVKREISFHGDTSIVTARIQANCNELGADLIISGYLKKILLEQNTY